MDRKEPGKLVSGLLLAHKRKGLYVFLSEHKMKQTKNHNINKARRRFQKGLNRETGCGGVGFFLPAEKCGLSLKLYPVGNPGCRVRQGTPAPG